MKEISIFIVEDYLLYKLSLRRELELSGMNVLNCFETAESCLENLKIQRPNVILMDLGLPGMNGIEATKFIKSHFPDIKVIILTSHDNEQEVIASLASGANAYCMKETPIETLISVIKMINNGALWLDPKIAQVAYKFMPEIQGEDNQSIIKLTKRENDVLKLLAQGKSNAEIAEEIIISPHTAKAHVCKILEKFAVSGRVQAAVKAVKFNLI